jgi:hypothetical protein
MESTEPMPTEPPLQESEGSAFGRMFNVLAAPGEVFAEIKERPVAHSNWLIPAVTWMILAITSVWILFSQDWAMREMRVMQQKAMDAKFEEAVRNGKMKQSDADNARKAAEGFMDKMGPMMMKIGAVVASFIGAFVTPFFWGLIIWLVGVKIFKADFEYMKAVEAAGIGVLIYALAGVVTVLLDFVLGHFTSISPAAFLPEFDVSKKTTIALAAINPLYLWYAAVLASATAVLSNVSWAKAAAYIFGFWIVMRVVFIAVGLGQATM